MGAADDAQRPSTNDDDAAMVSPVVLAQRKRRARAEQAPAVTPHDGAASFFDGKRNNSLDDLRKQLRQRPARIRDAPTTPPEAVSYTHLTLPTILLV